MVDVAIVSGASGGIGEACARTLLEQGDRVLLADVAEEVGRRMVEEFGDTAVFTSLDVTAEQSWEDAWETASRDLGRPTKLVNAAGIIRRTPLLETSVEEFLAVTGVNQLGTFLGLKVVGGHMADQGGGAIVNIGSIAAVRGLSGSASYGASKWAVRGLTFGAAHELGPMGVRVNCVNPGPIRTPMTANYDESNFAKSPMRRMGDPSEVAEVVAFLLSTGSSFVTGTELMIDGGVSLPVATG